MKFTVDLVKCQDHGQCVFAAPDVFQLDSNGKLNIRQLADTEYTGEVDESRRDAIEEAADMCPVQAIFLDD